MSEPQTRYDQAIAGIDAANGDDPNRVAVDGVEEAAEVVYARRMSRVLDRLYPDASEALRLAARAQHIRRWTSPRSDYPEGRVGYLKWRTDLKHFHARTVGEILAACGYGEDEIARVQALVRKERIKQDPEAQALEDVICVVFLEDYFADFAPKHDEDKVLDILRKTWAKMSPVGHKAALTLDLPPEAGRLMRKALAGDGAG
jgi:hypothetical protein